MPQPVTDVMVTKTKLDEPHSSHRGVKCLLYKAQKQPQPDLDGEKALKAKLAEIDSNMGFAHMLLNLPRQNSEKLQLVLC